MVDCAPTSWCFHEQGDMLANRTRNMPSIERIGPAKRVKLPSNRELAWATLEVLMNHRRPLATSEIPLPVVRVLSLDPTILNIPRKNGRGYEVPYRIGWVLTNLKNIGVVENLDRGYWGLTRLGTQYRVRGDVRDRLISQFGPEPLFGYKRSRRNQKRPDTDGEKNSSILDLLQRAESHVFENICRIFLQELGIIQISTTGRISDGSFEGTGAIRINTISFRVFFRCQRSTKSISKNEVISLRGTMAGRAENGLYITTGTFSNAAIEEAAREGVPPIGLINGSELSNQMRKLGVDERTPA